MRRAARMGLTESARGRMLGALARGGAGAALHGCRCVHMQSAAMQPGRATQAPCAHARASPWAVARAAFAQQGWACSAALQAHPTASVMGERTRRGGQPRHRVAGVAPRGQLAVRAPRLLGLPVVGAAAAQPVACRNRQLSSCEPCIQQPIIDDSAQLTVSSHELLRHGQVGTISVSVCSRGPNVDTIRVNCSSRGQGLTLLVSTVRPVYSKND